jgi:[acyl-carrier-protein] S-malonyltransferase
LCSQVRWKNCIERLIGEGVDTFIEMGPSEVLTRLTRWINREVKVHSADDPEALSQVFEGRRFG